MCGTTILNAWVLLMYLTQLGACMQPVITDPDLTDIGTYLPIYVRSLIALSHIGEKGCKHKFK